MVRKSDRNSGEEVIRRNWPSQNSARRRVGLFLFFIPVLPISISLCTRTRLGNSSRYPMPSCNAAVYLSSFSKVKRSRHRWSCDALLTRCWGFAVYVRLVQLDNDLPKILPEGLRGNSVSRAISLHHKRLTSRQRPVSFVVTPWTATTPISGIPRCH